MRRKIFRFFFSFFFEEFTNIRESLRATNTLVFICRILESKRFYFELHPSEKIRNLAIFEGHNGRHLVWRPRGDTLNLIWTRHCVQPPTPSSPVMTVPSRDAPVLSPPFPPIVVSHNARSIPLLPRSSSFSPLPLPRISLPPSPRCVFTLGARRCRYTRFCYINIGSISKCTPFTGPSPRILHQAFLATQRRGSVKSCLISRQGVIRNRETGEIWGLIFILREGRSLSPPSPLRVLEDWKENLRSIDRGGIRNLQGGRKKALELWILIED